MRLPNTLISDGKPHSILFRTVTCTQTHLLTHTCDSTPSKSIQEQWPLWNSRQKMPQPMAREGSESELEPRCVECNRSSEIKCVQCNEFYCDTCFKVVGIGVQILLCVCTTLRYRFMLQLTYSGSTSLSQPTKQLPLYQCAIIIHQTL